MIEPQNEGHRQALLALVERKIAWRRIFVQKDIPYLVSLMTAVDSREGDEFTFEHIREPLEDGEVWIDDDGYTLRTRDKNWRWQRFIVDRILSRRRGIKLKGRQIGVTWVELAVDVAEAILKPGTASLLFRQREDEAIDNARRWWTLYNSLPKWVLLRVPAGRKIGPVKVSKPDRGDRPGRDGVSLKFADGRFSDIVPMTSAAASGHGRSTRRIMLDEAAHIEKLVGIRAAVEPAAGQAHIEMISTANGRSNEETGEGNEFHRVWTTAEEEGGYDRLFLPYDLHPDRDEEWYETEKVLQNLPEWKWQEQYPRNADEAFALSDRVFFDPAAIQFYRGHIEKPIYRFNFEVNYGEGRAIKDDFGPMRMYRPPRPDRKYAIGADVAKGTGRDFSVAYVIDLMTMEFCVEYRAKVGEDKFAEHLHFLGRMYNTALIAPETQGGHGTAVIIALRDGAKGRPPYPKIYRHRNEAHTEHPDAKSYGMPMTPANRPGIVNQIEQHVRDESLPFVTDNLISEMGDFCEHDQGTSPRARDGAHDDHVLAAAISLELFRRYGMTMKRAVKKGVRAKRERAKTGAIDEARYPRGVRTA